MKKQSADREKTVTGTLRVRREDVRVLTVKTRIRVGGGGGGNTTGGATQIAYSGSG